MTIMVGDCRTVMAEMDADSVDAVICDPPYDLSGGFMGKAWDRTGVAFDPDTWRAALRVLKPGGHLLAFGGTRTFHRMAVAIEDAGFESRDTICWLYGSGFPKSLNVSKMIDKAAGAEREVVGLHHQTMPQISPRENFGSRYGDENGPAPVYGSPATPEAQQWDGWGTALKPAFEPILVCRKPLAKGNTIAANVLRYGTGALNIDACRIGSAGGTSGATAGPSTGIFGDGLNGGAPGKVIDGLGRWPANVILDEEAGALLDATVGDRKGMQLTSSLRRGGTTGEGIGYGRGSGPTPTGPMGYGDTGGPSRFFYCAKASTAERGEGNHHATVKPLALMRWLVKLVTPLDGLILDPFTGSGSTGVAAVLEDRRFAGIELDAEYAEIARRRIAHAAGPLFAMQGAAD